MGVLTISAVSGGISPTQRRIEKRNRRGYQDNITYLEKYFKNRLGLLTLGDKVEIAGETGRGVIAVRVADDSLFGDVYKALVNNDNVKELPAYRDGTTVYKFKYRGQPSVLLPKKTKNVSH